ncbi:MAG: ATP-binding protein [Spirosomaceae bacterium]|jgi:hypothetical protein|nr:ATP-binding protein [Spirosomataceae bacterium]
MRKYPVGIQDFSEVRTGGYLYVDKTHHIASLINQGKHYFLSRPRRFGKSLLISTIEYLYRGRRALFDGLYITDKWDWTQTNPVIKISFSNIGHKEKGLYKAIEDCLIDVAHKYGIVLQESANSSKFRELIERLSSQYGKVVVLIDEYDKPIIDFLEKDIPKALENRDILKAFYSVLKDADPFLQLVLLTGVSKFSKVSIFSDLNNLRDLTIGSQFSSICGITQTELETYFAPELEIYDEQKIKKWYNGYTWDGQTSVYNPFSLLSFFVSNGQFTNYWFETGTPYFLIELSKNHELYEFEDTLVSRSDLEAYDLENLQLIPLMFQTGYLTIKQYKSDDDMLLLGYPNEEVRQSYIERLTNAYAHNRFRSIKVLAFEMRDALQIANFSKVESIFNTVFKSIPYEIWQRENEHYYHALVHLTFRLLGIYAESQVQTADGRADAIVQVEKYVYAFEFKLDGSASEALLQIKERGYLQPYLYQGKTCIGIGLNFSKQDKKIEKLQWEEIKA